MLIYEKNNKLFGTLENFPGENDQELIYKDDQGAELTLSRDDVYLDNKRGGIIRKSDNKMVNVFIGDFQVIGLKKISTLEELEEVCAEGGNITIENDITAPNTVIIKSTANVNLNGKLIDTNTKLSNKNGLGSSVLSVEGKDSRVVLENGAIDAYTNVPGFSFDEDYNIAINVRDGAELTIKSGKIIGSGCCVYVAEGTAIIEGGEFKAWPDTSLNNKLFTLNCNDANYKKGTANIIVKGGKFYNGFNPADNDVELEPCNFVAEGFKSIYHEEENCYEVVPEE